MITSVGASDGAVARWARDNPRSAALYHRAMRLLPGGVTHDVRLTEPFPLAVARADGARKWDLDGHELVCYVMGHGALMLGHGHPEVVVGIKVRLGHQMVGADPGPALRLARQAADALGGPLMVHVIDLRPGLEWLLPKLSRGDIVTHCFHGNEGGILDGRGRVLPAAVSARERGVLFDVGHGWSSRRAWPSRPVRRRP